VKILQNEPEMPDGLNLRSPARPAVDPRPYRDAMAAIGATVGLATVRLDKDRLGRTVTSFFSLSIDPPTILVSIDRGSSFAAHVVTTGGFSFAMLAEGQEDVANTFAGAGDPERRFDTGRWTTWNSGHPRLEEALVAMDCELLGVIETGSHMLFAGGVVDLATPQDRAPLIWHRRRYTSVTH